jgi:hypothetical protein
VRDGAGIAGAARACAALLLALILAFALAGCQDAPGDGTGGSLPDPIFYEIASADGTVEGWMLGTIHALPPDTAWQTPAISDAIGTADLLIVEIAALDDRAALARTFGALASSPGLPPLFERIPADLRPQLRGLLERGDLSANALATTETWAAAIALAQVDAVGDPANGVDRALINAFAERPVRELEGTKAQLAIFDRLPEAQQRVMLASVLRESEAVRRDPTRLQRAWLAGDAAVIEASTREGFLADPALREALLVGRNRRWADTLAPMLAKPPRPLIAVGTAHLVGPEGLAALLEARGYRLRRLRRAP